MPKNDSMHFRINEERKRKLLKKAEGYDSFTKFMEEIADNNIIIVTPDVAKMFKLIGRKIDEKLQL